MTILRIPKDLKASLKKKKEEWENVVSLYTKHKLTTVLVDHNGYSLLTLSASYNLSQMYQIVCIEVSVDAIKWSAYGISNII